MRFGLAVLAAALHLPILLGAQERDSVSARLSGFVFDSLAGVPLPNATVQLVPLANVASAVSRRSDRTGAFDFDSLARGRYLLGFHHPLLDSLGISAPTLMVDVRASGNVRAELGIPSSLTILASRCGPAALRDSSGLMVGYVRSAADGMGKARATVEISWTEYDVTTTGLRRSNPSVRGTTSDGGLLTICGLPTGSEFLARAWSEGDSSGFAELVIPRSGVLRRDLYVGEVRRVVLRDSTDSVAVESTVLRGPGTLQGAVRGSNGRPVAGARLVFWGTGIEATTSADGRYQLQELPIGTYTLEARALGFLPRRRAVDILATGESVANLTLDPFAAFLDTVKVTTQRVVTSQRMREFEQRRRMGFGTFLDEDAIEKRNPFYMADLLRTTPGVTVAPSSSFGSRILMRGTGFQSMCVPTVFIDGVRVFNNDGDLDAIVNVQDVQAMEVYARGSATPAQFLTLEGCGAIVVWTGSRRSAR